MDADSYTIMRAITDFDDLSPTQKLVGLVLALHYNRASKASRLRRDTICEETGLGIRAVKAALRALVAAQVFDPKRTGRATAYRVGKRVEEWMVPLEHHQTVPLGYHREGAQNPQTEMPWDYDPSMSTRAEEENKYWERRL